jgi:hypothetical protein
MLASFSKHSEPRKTMTLPITTVAQLNARLHEQVLDVAALRFVLDVQGNRIAHTLSELFPRPHRRQSLAGFLDGQLRPDPVSGRT